MKKALYLVFIFLILIFSGCDNNVISDVYFKQIVDFNNGFIKPELLDIDPDYLIQNSKNYAKSVSGNLGLPSDFNLPFLMGRLHYQWGAFHEAVIFLEASKLSNDKEISLIADDYLIFSIILSRDEKRLNELKDKEINSMITYDSCLRLTNLTPGALAYAVKDLATSTQNNPVFRSMQYLEFLSRWAAANPNEVNFTFLQEQILLPSLRGFTGDASWTSFKESSNTRELTVVQSQLCRDMYSIASSAVIYATQSGQQPMLDFWSPIRSELGDLLCADCAFKRILNSRPH